MRRVKNHIYSLHTLAYPSNILLLSHVYNEWRKYCHRTKVGDEFSKEIFVWNFPDPKNCLKMMSVWMLPLFQPKAQKPLLTNSLNVITVFPIKTKYKPNYILWWNTKNRRHHVLYVSESTITNIERNGCYFWKINVQSETEKPVKEWSLISPLCTILQECAWRFVKYGSRSYSGPSLTINKGFQLS